MTRYKLAVLGNPIGHSRSPQIHEQFAAQAGIKIDYQRLLVPPGEFTAVAEQFLTLGHGFNITLPCKNEAWRFVNNASDAANEAQAVNTVSRQDDGSLRGDNTDGAGLVRDLTINLGWPLKGQRILLLGAGGAVSGVLANLLAERPLSLHLSNRTHEKAVDLIERLSATTAGTITETNLLAIRSTELKDNYDVIINGTSAGLTGGGLELPGRIVGDQSRCYDMIYGAGETRFIQWCRNQAACENADGLGMLVEQAAIAFGIWFARELQADIQTQAVIESIRKTLNQE